MPMTGESNKERRERLQREGGANGETNVGTRGNRYYGIPTSTLGRLVDKNRTPRERRYALEDAMSDLAKKRRERSGFLAPIQRMDDTYGLNEMAKIHNKFTNPNTREKYAKGGMVRGDGCCQRGKTKGTMR